jgi:hypothetical protein
MIPADELHPRANHNVGGCTGFNLRVRDDGPRL